MGCKFIDGINLARVPFWGRDLRGAGGSKAAWKVSRPPKMGKTLSFISEIE